MYFIQNYSNCYLVITTNMVLRQQMENYQFAREKKRTKKKHWMKINANNSNKYGTNLRDIYLIFSFFFFFSKSHFQSELHNFKGR